MKQILLLVLAVLGLIALVPTESNAQVIVSVNPGYSNGYYYQHHPYYRYHHHGYYTYYHNGRSYHSEHWRNND